MIAKRLSAACRHQDKDIISRRGRFNDILVIETKVLVPKYRSQIILGRSPLQQAGICTCPRSPNLCFTQFRGGYHKCIDKISTYP